MKSIHNSAMVGICVGAIVAIAIAVICYICASILSFEIPPEGKGFLLIICSMAGIFTSVLIAVVHYQD